MTYGLLRKLWRRGVAPTPSLDAALKTRSVEALRAFLEGEEALVENRWDEAAAAYLRATEADSTFWVAHGRYAYAMYWSLAGATPTLSKVLQRHVLELPERDRRFVEVMLISEDSLEAGLALSQELTERFPDNWAGWLIHADLVVHNGPFVGRRMAEARAAFEQALSLNPRLIPAWQHLTMITLQDRDSAATERCLAALTTLNAGPSMSAQGYGDQLLHFRLLSTLLRHDTSGAGPLIDSVADDVARHRNTGSSFYDPYRYGDFAIQLQLSRKVLRLGPTPLERTAHREKIALAWVARGAMDSALAVLDQEAQASADAR